MTPNRSSKCIVAAAAILGSATLASAQPQFYFDPLPELPGGASEPHDSFFAPGSCPFEWWFTVGRALDGDGIWKAVVWSKSGNQAWQIEALPNPFGNTGSMAFRWIEELARRQVVGSAFDLSGNPQPVVWAREGGGPWTAEAAPVPPPFDSGAMLSGSVTPDLILQVRGFCGWVDQAEGPEPRHAAAWQKDLVTGEWQVELLPDSGPGRSSEAKTIVVNPADGLRSIGGVYEVEGGFFLLPCVWQELPGGGFELIDLPLGPSAYGGSLTHMLLDGALAKYAVGYELIPGGIDFNRPAVYYQPNAAAAWDFRVQLPPLPGWRDAQPGGAARGTSNSSSGLTVMGHSYIIEPGFGGQSATLWEVEPDDTVTVYDLNVQTVNTPLGITLATAGPQALDDDPAPLMISAGTHTNDGDPGATPHGNVLIMLNGTDCNKNFEDDAIDLYSGTSIDENGNHIPDECDSVSGVPTVSAEGPRYLAVVPSPSPDPVALRLYHHYNYNTLSLGCLGLYVGADGQPSPYPVYLTHAPGEVVMVSGAEIVPHTRYAVGEERINLPELTCCYARGDAGCGEPPCEAVVCASDPYCCETRWDHFCAAAAQTGCPCAHVFPMAAGVTSVDTAKWGDVNESGAVNFLDISQLVDCFRGNYAGATRQACDLWPCVPDGINNFLDVSQGVDAFKGFPFPCSDPGDHACTVTGGPGCNDADMASCVCLRDPWCCTVVWDDVCVQNVVDWGCDGATHGCCETGGPGCDDPAVAACVCTQRPSCCNPGPWDSTCVAAVQWDGCGFCTLGPHSCCEAGEPGCQDPVVESCVCAVDPACCTDAWSDTCIDTAETQCNTCSVDGLPCKCASLKFQEKTLDHDKTIVTLTPGVGSPTIRVVMDFEVAAVLKCSPPASPKNCRGIVKATHDSSDFEGGVTIDLINVARIDPPSGGRLVTALCNQEKDVKASYKYRVTLHGPGGANIPNIIGTVKIKIELECDNDEDAARTLTFRIDSRNPDGGGNDMLDEDLSDMDGDGLTGQDEEGRETDPQKWDTDEDAMDDKEDREPRDD